MSSPKLIKLKPSVIGSFILIIFVLINMVLYYIIKSHVINGFIFTYSSLFVSSFMCSVIFVYSVSMKARDANANVIRLYAADLIGGSIAAIVTGIIIIPFGGLTAVPIGIIGMLLFCMLMII